MGNKSGKTQQNLSNGQRIDVTIWLLILSTLVIVLIALQRTSPVQLAPNQATLDALTSNANNIAATKAVFTLTFSQTPTLTSTFTATETFIPTLPTETPTLFTDTPTTTPLSSIQLTITPQTLDLKIWVEVIECECNKKEGWARIRIDFVNGENPFEISGQAPVTKRTVAFNVRLGSTIYLVITSKDGLKWEGPIPIPTYCEPPKGQCKEQQKPTPEPKTQCNDNKDNDFDGKIDYPEDPGCEDKSDNSEWPFNWP